MEFIYGLIIGILLCLGIQWGIKRLFRGNGDNNKSGLEVAVGREQSLQGRITDNQETVSRIEDRNEDTEERISSLEDRVESSGSLADRIQKENNF